MKKNCTILYALSIIVMASCVKDPSSNGHQETESLPRVVLTADEIASIAYDNVEELTEENVVDILKGFVDLDSEKTGATRASADLPIRVKSKYYIHVDDKDVVTTSIEPTVKTRSGDTDVFEAPIYELAISNGSTSTFALVSGDPRAPKVLAYIPDATEETKTDINVQIMLAMAKASVMEDVKKIEAIKNEFREQTLEKLSIEWEMPKEEIQYESVAQFLAVESATRGYVNGEYVDENNVKAPDDFANVQIMGYVSPLGVTSWHQDSPYNRALPTDLIEVAGEYKQGKRVAGCGVITMAETLAILKPTGYFDGIRIDWSRINAQEECYENPPIPGMPNNNSPAATLEHVGRLIKSVYYDSNTEPIYQTLNDGRRVNVGSTTSAAKMISYMGTKANFNSARAWDPDIAKASLTDFKPVLCYGNARVKYHNDGIKPVDDIAGHSYLIDGYLITRKKTRQLVKLYDVYWHCRLGWGAASNGYYKLSTDTKCKIIVDNEYMQVAINVGETGNITVNGKSYDIGQYMLSHLTKK